MRELELKDTKIAVRTILIVLSLIIWLAMLIFIISLYSINLQITSLWKFRLLILYGFMALGGIAAGFLGEKNNLMYIIGVVTFFIGSVTDFMWHGKGFGLWGWQTLVLIAGFAVGKIIMHAVQKGHKQKTIIQSDSQPASVQPPEIDKPLSKARIKFRYVRTGVLIVVILAIAFLFYDLGVHKGIHLAKILTKPERSSYTKHGFMKIREMDTEIVLNKPDWFDTLVIKLPLGLTTEELNRFINLEYGEFGNENWEKAIKSYYYVISIKPSVGYKNRIRIGHCYRWNDDFQRAVVEYLTAHDSVPENDPEKDWFACYSLYEAAWCYTMLSDYENAVATFERCIEYLRSYDEGARYYARKSEELIDLIQKKQYDEIKEKYIK